MDIKFVVDDCVLIWNILFGPSVSDSIYKLKQKLWLNYKNEYNAKVNSDKTGIDLIETNLAFPELKSFSFKDNGPIFDWKNGKILSSSDLVADQECYFAYYYGSYEKESVLIPCGIEVNIF